ncbi:hypothetical protein HKX48_006450 [Thoreauomyces humboldtii]|nr:hypothetical protein HKX48_006450 [Thoreauomyces humboldtii]
MNGYPTTINDTYRSYVPAQSDDPRKTVQADSDRGLKFAGKEFSNQELEIGGGLLGTAAALGIGYFGFEKYKTKKSEDRAEGEWGLQNWEEDAHRRQAEYLEAVKNNADLPPLTWVLTEHNNIPQGAIKGGQDADNNPIYIARTYHSYGIHVGGCSPVWKDGAHIAVDGKEVVVPKFEVLLGFESAVRWVEGAENLDEQEMEGRRLVESGCKDQNGDVEYIAQAHLHNAVCPGKVTLKSKGAIVAFEGDERREKHYRFLTYA